MNTTLQQDVCDVLGTISPDEKTVKKYEGLTQSNEDAQTFLSLLKSPFIFKAIVCYESPEGNFAKEAFRLLQNGMINDEWMELKEAYLNQISNFFSDHPSKVISKYISFEMELVENVIDAYPNGDDILEAAKVQRMDIEEELIKKFGYILENLDDIDGHQQELRYLLEVVVILNTTLLEDPKFENLFEKHRPVLRALFIE